MFIAMLALIGIAVVWTLLAALQVRDTRITNGIVVAHFVVTVILIAVLGVRDPEALGMWLIVFGWGGLVSAIRLAVVVVRALRE
ncbi:hypothetical protein DP939_40980 [Spongiactinospora rosea]|uniref:Uncharacterized protein n=1 Tax=Spongiactinospora rosea TaxID=2248750 RepID=A0A366LKJ6_9ACTN|nr:hypothetical protein [Spongiactinospora rosea]RBQ14337.1 hypothetical protein DP939_40980 [Spongiactinospora rosea]